MGYPIYLAGRVALASGEALYEPVRIAITCGGHAIPQVYTDARGRFNFQPKCRPLLALSDASLRSFSLYPGFGQGLTTTTGTANLMGCELFAELPGHWSTRVRLGLVAAPARNEVGLIILSPLDNSTGRSVSVTTLTAPPGAKKAYWNGLRALRKRKPDFRKAANLFERAVKLHPEHAQAWAALGEARAALGEADRAKEAFARSIQSDPELLQPYDAMIRIAARNRDWAHLDSLATKYLKLAPGSSRVRFYSAVAAWELGDIARTESTIKQMEELGELDGWPMSYVIMALAHERRADFETAADYYEQYIEISVDAEISSLARRAIYDWGHLQVIETRPVTLAHAAEPE
ncbi:MAG: tetratricopeptide repeat protein [Acidobacteriia bacterium]|nr:tetratricopeptide repeat protein [Terriglobia bacterium]MYG03769.1 tetratricopeptide repeat protein [Terriglobia bacterium]